MQFSCPVSGNQDKFPPGIIWSFPVSMAARDQQWPVWKEGLGTAGCECVQGCCAQQTNGDFSLPQEEQGYGGTHGFILGLLSEQGRKGCSWLLKIHSPRPDRLQANGKVINSCLPQTEVGQQLRKKAEMVIVPGTCAESQSKVSGQQPGRQCGLHKHQNFWE